MINRIKARLVWAFIQVKYLYLCKFSQLPNVATRKWTLDKIISDNLSISRFGDGEYDLIQGKSLKFQEYNNELSKKLKFVLSSKLDKHMTCLPDIYSGANELKEGSVSFAKETAVSSAPLLKGLANDELYGNAYITRFYIALKESFRDNSYPIQLKRLWENRKLLIIEGTQSRLGVGNDLFENAKSIERILCPSTNSFTSYDDILKVIDAHYNNQLVLLALGPTATVLAYDLALKGIQALDIGHVDIEYEWYKMSADFKVDIPNKHVNEVSGVLHSDIFVDPIYESQIIARVT